MKKIIYCFSAILFAVLTLQSCDQEFDYIIEGEETLLGNKIIKKITHPDIGVVSNFVVENGRLTNYNSAEGTFNFNVFYGENGKISLVTDANADDLTFNYNSDEKLISVSGTEEFPEYGIIMPIETTFEYDNLGRMIKSTTMRRFQFTNINSQSESGVRIKNFYTYDSNNNISSITFKQEIYDDSATDAGLDTEYFPFADVLYQNLTYDDKLSVFTNLPKEFLYCYFAGTFSGEPNNDSAIQAPALELISFTTNNIISGTYSIDMANTDEGDVSPTDFTMDYVYDTNGYPTSGSSSTVGNVLYEYQPYNP